MAAEQLSTTVNDAPFRVGVWQVDPALDQISRGEEIVRLEPRTMRLLVRLADAPGQVVSSRELLDTVWSGVVVGPASVYQAISQLRKLLGDTDPVPTFIATVPRKGYRLVAPVERIASVATESPPVVEVQPAPTPPAKRPPAYVLWGVAAAVVIAIGSGAWVTLRDSQPAQTAGVPARPATLDSRAIVIAPFEPATQDEATQTLAPIVTDLLRTRLAGVQNLVVIASGSIVNAMQTEQNLDAVARKVHARYLLKGDVTRAGGQVRMNVTLMDVESGSPMWSKAFEQPIEQIAAINQAVVQQTANSLQIALEPGSTTSGDAPADLSTYELYLRGQQLLTTFRAAEADQSAVIFARVTTLDPSFARGYFALGQALLLSVDLGARAMNEDVVKQAGRAIDRALELNPALGPAWAQRARLTADPVQAEEMYRRALQLAPSYDENYIRYSDFLFSQGRRGEALELINRARRIDPLSATLRWREAQLLIATRSDVAGMERLLHEALELKPDFPTALRDLANSQYLWHGNFAEAIRLMERAKVIDPDARWADSINAELYLEVGDLAVALSLLEHAPHSVKIVARETFVSILLYQRDIKRAAELARNLLRESLPSDSSSQILRDELRSHALHQELVGHYWATANALRDEAILTGNFATARDLIERATQLYSGSSLMRNRGLVLTYAHVLLLSGDTRRGREVLTSLLEQLDAEQIGRPANMYAWERAAIHAMLGDNERALSELAASQQMGRFVGWWYIAELDPIYSNVRGDPRFQALAAKARAHSQGQRALLDEMRRKGEVPKRG
jgi:DNA-binding winged helix-turn-helix (wHTH) protein/TolB-like protein/Tfp pilus assembly protein PilF